jgi:hypothetical protein
LPQRFYRNALAFHLLAEVSGVGQPPEPAQTILFRLVKDFNQLIKSIEANHLPGYFLAKKES